MLAAGRDGHHSGREDRRSGNGSGHDDQSVSAESDGEFLTGRNSYQVGPRCVEGDLTRLVVTPSTGLHSRPLDG